MAWTGYAKLLARYARWLYITRMRRTQGGTLLQAWLRDEHRTQEWLASQLDTYQANVSRWIRGGPLPRLSVLLEIRSLTGIPVEAWAEPADESMHAA